MNHIRLTVLVVALIQILIASLWLILVCFDPNPGTWTIVHLLALIGCGVLGLIARKNGQMIRTAIALNWILVILWSIGLLQIFSMFLSAPEHHDMLLLNTMMRLALIFPCVLNGFCLIKLSHLKPRT